ncbi:MAG: hypothetical protein HFJ38_06030 [Bacilli bacterium]|nr:hypothetical protein [Bacilli bacterium]
MEKYILLYGDKKKEDNIWLINNFKNIQSINLGWTDFDYSNNMKIIEKYINKGIEQIIFSGLEIGWDKLITDIKEKNNNLKIKVICNTQDSLLYYEYERENFFKLLELSKKELVDDIAFLRKGQYETYKSLGYKASYLMENYILKPEKKVKIKEANSIIDLGIYPLNYTWDKNIFNQLCIAKFLDNCNLNYNRLDERMEDFLNTMQIHNTPESIEIVEEKIIEHLSKNDIIIATSFTDYVHPIFLISMELGIPCLIGNNSDFFEKQDDLKKYVVTNAEDNPITNSEMVKEMIKNKEKIQELYQNWKQEYNKQAQKSIQDFINK